MSAHAFEFLNAAGERLSGRLEGPQGLARGWAVFAHCFTCGKDNLAATRISRALALEGFGVLRFDFTGLGASEGRFGDTSFSLNVQDLQSAAAAMAAAGMAPSLLIGHSLGGAAVLAAAGAIESVVAVATIAAPFDVAHVLAQFDPAGLAQIESTGRAEVVLGGRGFCVGLGLVDDLRRQDQARRIAALRHALLVLHASGDRVVDIDHATRIFVAAHHPKSFVSLGGADHLLSDRRDAEYAAKVIAGWASRYLPVPEREEPTIRADAVATETGNGKFQLELQAGGARWLADEPASIGGLGSGPSPYDLLSSALAACTTMTLRHFADSRGWPINRIATAVDHRKDRSRTPADSFSRRISIDGELSDEQRAQLLATAERCPVHRTLASGSRLDGARFLDAEDEVEDPEEIQP